MNNSDTPEYSAMDDTIIETYRKCGLQYTFYDGFEEKELCGLDLCYSCVCLRHQASEFGDSFVYAQIYSRNFKGCLNCKYMYVERMPKVYKEIEVHGNCANCSAVKTLERMSSEISK